MIGTLRTPIEFTLFGLLFKLGYLNSVQVMFKEQLGTFKYAGGVPQSHWSETKRIEGMAADL